MTRRTLLLVAAALTFAWSREALANSYVLTDPGLNWIEAEAQANSLGGHLVAINSAEENDLLLTLFGGVEPFWIGLTDRDIEGVYVWTNGDPLTYSSWAPGEPNNSGDEDYVNTNDAHGPGLWNDGHYDTRAFRGIVEIVPEPGAESLLPLAALGLLAAKLGRRRTL